MPIPDNSGKKAHKTLALSEEQFRRAIEEAPIPTLSYPRLPMVKGQTMLPILQVATPHTRLGLTPAVNYTSEPI
jgi:hypothetical protein